MFPTDGRPGDERGFLHKSFIGKAVGKAFTTFVPGASIARDVISTGRSLFSRGRGGISTPRPTVSPFLTARVTPTSQAQIQRGLDIKFPAMPGAGPPLGFHAGTPLGTIPFHGNGNGNGTTTQECPPPLRRSSQGNCIFPGSPRGAELFLGEPILGQYGAGTVAGSQIIDRATCGRGQQLGNDGVCYNKSQITNKQRMWPAGRKPLLSGGDMRAISTAARAGKRLEGATKRLQRMGMMRKPARSAQRRVHPALKVPVHQVVDV